MKKYLCAAVLWLAALPSSQAGIDDQNFGHLQVRQVTSIYDGDTFRATLYDMPPIIGDRIAIRVSGVDTPEMRGSCEQEKHLARLAKQFTVDFLRKSEVIELRNVTRGKYFRIVADVYGDGQSLTHALLQSRYAVPYHGGSKSHNWCA